MGSTYTQSMELPKDHNINLKKDEEYYVKLFQTSVLRYSQLLLLYTPDDDAITKGAVRKVVHVPCCSQSTYPDPTLSKAILSLCSYPDPPRIISSSSHFRSVWDKKNISPQDLEGSVPQTKRDYFVEDWWKLFRLTANYQLYCIILGDEFDQTIADLMELEGNFLDTVSGKECCFIYLRDLKRAKNLEPFILSEHARWNTIVGMLTDIKSDELPCLLFFEDLTKSDWAKISLQNMDRNAIKALIQDLFKHIRERGGEKTVFQALKQYKKVYVVKQTGKSFARWINEYTPAFLAEFFKALIGSNVKIT